MFSRQEQNKASTLAKAAYHQRTGLERTILKLSTERSSLTSQTNRNAALLGIDFPFQTTSSELLEVVTSLNSGEHFRLSNLQKILPGCVAPADARGVGEGLGIALINRHPHRGNGKLPLRCHFALMPLLFLHLSACDRPANQSVAGLKLPNF